MRINPKLLAVVGLLPALLFMLPSFIGQQSSKQPIRNIQIKAISGLQYDQVRFKVAPGERVRITLINTDEMAHNMVITVPNKREEVVALALTMGEEGQNKNFVPQSDFVLASSPVLLPGSTYSFNFTAPKEEGIYPYVCTYPGHGAVMYGAIYVTNEMMPPLANDSHVPPQRRGEQTKQKEAEHPYPATFPRMYRSFMPDTGPASIAVGMTNQLSYCWDAGACRFRYLWKDGFIDLSRHWGGKGKELADIVGTIFYREENMPFRVGPHKEMPESEYIGYVLEDHYPTFKYRLNGVEVEERIRPTLDKAGMYRQFSFKNPNDIVWYQMPRGQQVEVDFDQGRLEGQYLKLSPSEASSFTLTIAESKQKI